MKAVANGERALYSKNTREHITQALGVDNLNTSTIQGKVRKLERNEPLTRNSDGSMKINNSYFHTWIIDNEE